MTIEQDINNLQGQINDLKGEQTPFINSVTKSPFNKLEQIKLETGTTGSARFKKLLLDIFWNTSADEQHTKNTHGNWTNMLHWDLASSGTTTRWCRPTLMPDDCITEGISSSINWLWTSSSSSGNVELNITVEGFNKDSGAVGATTFLDSTPVTIPNPTTAVDTIKLETINLTTRPKASDLISCKFERIADDGNDTSTGALSIYAVWIEYLAFF